MTPRILALAVGVMGGCEHSPGTVGPVSTRHQAQAVAEIARPVVPAPSGHVVLVGGRIPGRGAVDIEIEDGRIAALGSVEPNTEVPMVDVRGHTLVPALVDSHVHLTYRFGEGQDADAGARRLATAGLGAVVDLAAPIHTLGRRWPQLRLVAAGPMLTAPQGYPTRGWGRDGYGQPRRGEAALRQAVQQLHDAGARVIKVAMHGPPSLTEPELRAIVTQAHALELPVVAHALGDPEAALAARVGIDVLAHTPLEPLHPDTVTAWSGRAVISTLAAFGGSPVAVDNLRRLREAGATVLYGTDLGNPGVAATGISEEEIELLRQAGLDGAQILEAATTDPARQWGLSPLGTLEVGGPATLLVLRDDPTRTPTTLASPVAVYIDGVAQGSE